MEEQTDISWLHDKGKAGKAIYFLGIGGIGMSALARYFNFHKWRVSGYDKMETMLTKQLIAEGIPVHYEADVDLIPKDAELVVYTPALPSNHTELLYYREHGFKIQKRSEVLGEITAASFNICVAGTHGKTTLSTMIAHILRDSGYGCNAFLGGIAVNYDSNFWSNQRNVCVVEADEYDRSFLKLRPDIAVITAMDADHLDIYGTEEAVQDAFVEFAHKLKKGGLLVHRMGLRKEKEFPDGRRLTYDLYDEKADVHAAHIRIQEGSYMFDVLMKDWKLMGIKLNMGGLHNMENATAAIAVAHAVGIKDEAIKSAIGSFKGVKRRFEYIVRNDHWIYIDDYAHHPEELRALIGGAKNLFPGLPCTVVFQPHLFTRTRDFADGFAGVLDMADEVYLLPIYPARELPIDGVSSGMIAAKMSGKNVHCVSKEEFLQMLAEDKESEQGQRLLITAGAGDIDRLVEPIRELLKKKD